MNIDTPKGLLRCVFYYNGKCFCLRGGQEHRELGISQLKRLYNPDRYIYSEKSSKNRPGETAQIRLEHKTVPIFANHAAGIRCHVFLLDTYIKKLPPTAIFTARHHQLLQKISPGIILFQSGKIY